LVYPEARDFRPGISAMPVQNENFDLVREKKQKKDVAQRRWKKISELEASRRTSTV